MPRLHNRKGRSNTSGRFVKMDEWWLDTLAWLHLSCNARSAMIELLRIYNGTNNGRIAMSARDLGERLNCSKDTANRALTELDDVGFIECTAIGKFSRKDRLASEYRVTMHKCDKSNQKGSRAFLEWIPAQSHPRDRTGATERRQKQSYSRQSNQRACQRSYRSVNGLTGATHVDLTMGSRPVDIEKQSNTINPTGATVIPFRTADEMPELPSFLDRRGGGAQR